MRAGVTAGRPTMQRSNNSAWSKVCFGFTFSYYIPLPKIWFCPYQQLREKNPLSRCICQPVGVRNTLSNPKYACMSDDTHSVGDKCCSVVAESDKTKTCHTLLAQWSHADFQVGQEPRDGLLSHFKQGRREIPGTLMKRDKCLGFIF